MALTTVSTMRCALTRLVSLSSLHGYFQYVDLFGEMSQSGPAYRNLARESPGASHTLSAPHRLGCPVRR